MAALQLLLLVIVICDVQCSSLLYEDFNFSKAMWKNYFLSFENLLYFIEYFAYSMILFSLRISVA